MSTRYQCIIHPKLGIGGFLIGPGLNLLVWIVSSPILHYCFYVSYEKGGVVGMYLSAVLLGAAAAYLTFPNWRAIICFPFLAGLTYWPNRFIVLGIGSTIAGDSATR